MATEQEQAQVNLGVADANLLVTKLAASHITWSTKVPAKISAEFAGLVNTNLNPLYSSPIPIGKATTTLTNFSKKYIEKSLQRISERIITRQVDVTSLDLWNTQYVAWSAQLPIILQLGGIDNNKAPTIINLFSIWYNNNIVSLIPTVRISAPNNIK